MATSRSNGAAAKRGGVKVKAAKIEPSEPVREESGLHLHWEGRRSYRTAIPTPRVLQPDPTLSFGDQDSGNLIIEGDNLQAMVSLQSQFADAIDVVYIGPYATNLGRRVRMLVTGPVLQRQWPPARRMRSR